MSFDDVLDKHYFLLRRVHSLTGVAPIGVFLFPHLTTNSSIVWGNLFGHGREGGAGATHGGVETFQHEVDFIYSLPALPIIEWTVLFGPIMIHIVLGIWFARTGRTNVSRYGHAGNWRYAMQRWTGYLGVLFIFMHLSSLRFGLTWGGLLPAFDPSHAASSTARHFQSSVGLLVTAFYLVSVLALIFHFANGLWTAGLTWGLTVSVAAQRRWGVVCAILGVLLAVAGLTAVVGFRTLDADQAEVIETRMSAVGEPEQLPAR